MLAPTIWTSSTTVEATFVDATGKPLKTFIGKEEFGKAKDIDQSMDISMKEALNDLVKKISEWEGLNTFASSPPQSQPILAYQESYKTTKTATVKPISSSRLFVKTEPQGARIRILNIKPKFILSKITFKTKFLF